MPLAKIVHVGNALDLEGFPISAASRVGDLVFTAGLVALDPETGAVVEGGIERQARRVLDNLELVLAAADCSAEDVAIVHVFLADIERDLAEFNRVYSERFRDHHPPRYAVGVRLAWPELLVELHAVAARRAR